MSVNAEPFRILDPKYSDVSVMIGETHITIRWRRFQMQLEGGTWASNKWESVSIPREVWDAIE